MLTTLLQYNTSDFNFLEANLNQCSKFSEQVIITICTNFFGGEKENEDLLHKSEKIISSFSNTKIIWIPYDNSNYNPPAYYHNLSRYTAMNASNTDWVLFSDTDEIMEEEFSIWFEQNKNEDKCYNFSSHWYFREPIFQAIQKESAGVLARKHHCELWDLQDNRELKQFYEKLIQQNKLVHGDYEKIVGPSGNIMMHHYSWVRTKEQMLKKVMNWGHKNDKKWVELVEEEFSRPFYGTDFVHGYQYKIVENKFNIQL